MNIEKCGWTDIVIEEKNLNKSKSSLRMHEFTIFLYTFYLINCENWTKKKKSVLWLLL